MNNFWGNGGVELAMSLVLYIAVKLWIHFRKKDPKPRKD